VDYELGLLVKQDARPENPSMSRDDIVKVMSLPQSATPAEDLARGSKLRHLVKAFKYFYGGFVVNHQPDATTIVCVIAGDRLFRYANRHLKHLLLVKILLKYMQRFVHVLAL
jgi:hypothetical protein